jgi:hypothetical protein
MVGSPSAPIGTPPKPEFVWGNQAFDIRAGWNPPSMLKHSHVTAYADLLMISPPIRLFYTHEALAWLAAVYVIGFALVPSSAFARFEGAADCTAAEHQSLINGLLFRWPLLPKIWPCDKKFRPT